MPTDPAESSEAAPTRIARLLVGVDGTVASQRALAHCAELATALHADVIAVHVVSRTWLTELNALQIDTAELMASARAHLVGPWTEELRERGIQYSTDLLRGDPATELLQAAERRHCDMIVIGGTHHGGLRDALLGGTAHRTVNRSVLPVLVVPTLPSRPEPGWPPIPG